MSLVIGPLTLQGTDAQNAILKPMAERIAHVLSLPDGTYRVKAANVYVRARNEMPWAIKPGTSDKYPKGVRSRGYWNGRDQLLADDLFPTPDLARKTFAHESAHQLDDQWMLRSNRRDIRPLFDPDPAGWPSEPFAVYGSAAIFGFTNPPYKSFYPGAVVAPADYDKLRQAALRDDHGPTQEQLLEACKSENAALKQELAETGSALTVAEAALAAEQLAHEATRAALADAEARLAACKDAAGKAAQA